MDGRGGREIRKGRGGGGGNFVNSTKRMKFDYFRKIFWSDWNRASPKLEWANEDGTDRAIFLQGDYVKLPNSLSIDWAMDELCWADAGTFTISKSQISP